MDVKSAPEWVPSSCGHGHRRANNWVLYAALPAQLAAATPCRSLRNTGFPDLRKALLRNAARQSFSDRGAQPCPLICRRVVLVDEPAEVFAGVGKAACGSPALSPSILLRIELDGLASCLSWELFGSATGGRNILVIVVPDFSSPPTCTKLASPSGPAAVVLPLLCLPEAPEGVESVKTRIGAARV